MLDFCINFIASLISVFGISLFFCRIANIKVKFNYCRALILIGYSFVITFLQILPFKFLNVIAIALFYPIFFKVISKKSFKKLFIIVSCIWFIGALIDIANLLIISYIFNVVGIKMLLSVYTLISTILVNCVFLYLGSVNWFKRFINKIINYLSRVLFLDIFIIFFMIFLTFIGYLLIVNLEIKISLSIAIIIILVIIVFLFILRAKYMNNEYKMLLNNLKNNSQIYVDLNDEYKMFKHNINAKLLTIKSIANEKAQILITDLMHENVCDNYSVMVKKIPYGIDGIIYEKLYNREDIFFEVNNSISDDIYEILKPRNYNLLIEVLSLILDNALEALLNSKEKFLEIDISMNDDFVIVKVINTFEGNLDIDDLGKFSYSTKGKSRGMGLFSIFRLKNIKVDVKIVNNKFISLIKVGKKY